MTDTVKMRALMTLPGRKRGETFDATAQEARDLERNGRAERVAERKTPPAKSDSAG